MRKLFLIFAIIPSSIAQAKGLMSTEYDLQVRKINSISNAMFLAEKDLWPEDPDGAVWDSGKPVRVPCGGEADCAPPHFGSAISDCWVTRTNCQLWEDLIGQCCSINTKHRPITEELSEDERQCFEEADRWAVEKTYFLKCTSLKDCKESGGLSAEDCCKVVGEKINPYIEASPS